VAFLLTVGGVLFFARPPTENHTWKKPDNIPVSFSDIERPTCEVHYAILITE
jgi:hypothetical protein